MSNLIAAQDYKRVLENMPICCVDVVVVHKGKVLLVWRTNKPAKNEWWPPGGRVHKGEELEDAVKRKVFEEVGLNVKVERQIKAYSTVFPDGPFDDLESGVHSINIGFLATVIDENPEVKIDGTSGKYCWISDIREDLPDYVKQIIRDSGVFSGR